MRKFVTTGACLAGAVVLAACGSGGTATTSAENYPEEPLEWTVAFGPGGGNDIMSRQSVDILEKEEIYTEDITVENIDAGSGAVGWGKVHSNAGNGYSISSTSGSFLTTPLASDTGWEPTDFTHVGLLAQDASLFLTSEDSDLTTWEDWVKYAKDKGRVAVGGIGVVNIDLLLLQALADQAGYEIEYVPFNEESQLITGLSSGSLDAVTSNPAEVLGQVESGDMNPLLYTGDEPMPGLEEVPTAKDKGYTDMVTTPRGVILPPDVSDEIRQWWIDALKQVVETPEWQQYLKENNLTPDERWGDEFSEYVEETETDLETRLEDLGKL
jgi:tripartite-type tricarboxylate transporter receptor subunit TctC